MAKRRRIAVVVKGYPRLSETFIAQEILGLERRGLAPVIVSLRHPTDTALHDLHHEITAPVLYLPEYLRHEPWRVVRAWWRLRRSPTYQRARALWLADLWRDRTANRIRRFGQALVLAAELSDEVALLYAHYLHTPASVTRYAAALSDLPWCNSAHAKDLWITPAWEKREKLASCRWLTTCTALGADHLRALAPAAEILLIRHGLDAPRFPAPASAADGRHGRDGSDGTRPVRLLGVARLVEKKGVDLLLDALAALPAAVHWTYTHVGDGPLAARLGEQAARLGLNDRVRFLGALPRARVIEVYQEADLFVLANRIAADGDRDGLPNVLLEAGVMALPLVASDLVAVPELIEDGVHGRLVAPGDAVALAAVLAELIADPASRQRLGAAARARVLESFAMEPGLDRLAARLRATIAEAAAGRGARVAA